MVSRGRSVDRWRRGPRRTGTRLTAVARRGVTGRCRGAGVTWHDRSNFQERADAVDEGLVQVGWGLNLALAASVSLVVAAGVIGERRRQRNLVASGKAAPPVSKRPKRPSTASPAPTTQPVEPVTSPPKDESPPSSSVGELERLAALHASGALSDDEFQAAKRRVLGG